MKSLFLILNVGRFNSELGVLSCHPSSNILLPGRRKRNMQYSPHILFMESKSQLWQIPSLARLDEITYPCKTWTRLTYWSRTITRMLRDPRITPYVGSRTTPY
ncbi:hypothetical protein TorRG33x02_069290 [Trema orientale]|uniref:Uncharacterized protein n=1 Tax=Trema orientale TaxID=63057 RepID=A0A2P5FH93_TREOI|nr:hypothetical protein TorRG33x02_069290 [Trema orientale]